MSHVRPLIMLAAIAAVLLAACGALDMTYQITVTAK